MMHKRMVCVVQKKLLHLNAYGLKAGSSSLWLGNSNWSSRVTRLYDRWNADVKALSY
jgi:hypothetical protein